MTPEELREQSDLYAFGLLEGAELAAFQEELRSNPEARTAAREGAALVARLSGMVQLVNPPARLRSRVLAMIDPAHGARKSVFGWGLVFAASSLMLLVVAGMLSYQINRLSLARRADAARFASTAALMAAPDTREVTFGQGAPKPPRGRVFVNPRGVVLLAANLETLPAGKTYEMWIIPKGRNPVPAGLFQAKADGTALHVDSESIDVATVGAVAVTVEAAAGAAQPTSTPISVAAVGT